MSFSDPFINRPVGTTLLTLAIMLAGGLGYIMLPVSPLPQVDSPTISVSASLPGASAETMASAVASPLEKQFGRIAGVTEMSSTSGLGSTSVTLQFDLNRDIDSAARDVQAAINAARGQLPANLPNNPTYRKSNPSDSPIMILALTSETYSKSQMYDVASTILQQRLSQVLGVGQVFAGGASPPAVRVEVNPTILNNYGLGMEDIRTTLAAANANRPKGQLSDGARTWTLSTTDQLFAADKYRPLIVAYRNGAPIRLGDVAEVTDAVEDVRTTGFVDGRPSVTLIVFRQPAANIISTVDRVRELIPQLQSQIPADIKLVVASDRTATIRSSIEDVQFTLMISVGLVILVVFLFLRDLRATFIPSVSVPVSLISTFGVMYLLGYSVNNLSLMALTIATGFVVDDAIVVIENVSRHMEAGMPTLEATRLGTREIGFTVFSISVSLIAVFIPILMMGGVVGRLFREFAVTLAVAITISMLVSLTTTPMLCAALLKPHAATRRGWFFRMTEWVLDGITAIYKYTLIGVLRHQRLTMVVMLATIALNIYLYLHAATGYFPQQDTGRITGNIVADQGVSFRAMRELVKKFSDAVGSDPDVNGVVSFAGGTGGQGGAGNSARLFANLNPLGERKSTATEVIDRIRAKTSKIAGANLVLQAVQDVRVTGRSSSAPYQYNLTGDLKDLNEWAPKVLEALRKIPLLIDVVSDQQNRGLQVALTIDRDAAMRLGITPQRIDDALYDAFGQRQVSTMYRDRNQYRVVMIVQSDFWQNPDGLKSLYVRTEAGTQVPLSTVARYERNNTPLSVSHSGVKPSVTISFALVKGASLGEAVERVQDATTAMGLPESIEGRFSGTAQAFKASMADQPLLILAALVTVYIVLGILYESYIHPITILSTLPSAGVGALLALRYFQLELSLIALIGIFLLIGIVKKNAIMMIDFALEAERKHGLDPQEAIFQACLLRFRPITMTTMAALLGGLPLALGKGNGAELRQPLGVAIVGGLIFSQMLTLYTTPVVYIYMDHLRLWFLRHRQSRVEATGWHGEPAEAVAPTAI